MNWYWYVIAVVIIFLAGVGTCWAFLRNNPKYLKPEVLLQKKKDALFAEIETKYKEMKLISVEEVKKMISDKLRL